MSPKNSHAILVRVTGNRHGVRTAFALLATGASALALAAPSQAAPQASVAVYGGSGGVVETIPGRPVVQTPPATTPPGGGTQPIPPVTNPPVANPPVQVPGEPVDTATATDAPEATERGLLSLPSTGLAVGLVLAAGLLLTGVGLATRRLVGPVRA